jgi:signal transduction histidine kinase/tetratricopeptide (TPR) repeat protein
MGVIIASASIISVLAITMVSQQGKVRELRIREGYNDRLASVKDHLDRDVQATLEQVFARVGEDIFLRHSPDSVLGRIKEIVLENPIVQYPFILELKKETFLFPFSRKAPGSVIAIADKALADPAIRSIYREARRVEVDKRQYSAAISLYQKAYRHTNRLVTKLYISNAIARCYFKSNRFRQALWYYHRNLVSTRASFRRERELHFLTLRQIALSYKLMRLNPQALQFYLNLYEAVISNSITTNPNVAEMFKNEALDYLNQYTINDDEESERFNRAKASDRLKQASSLDIALSWMFFELESPASSGGIEDSDTIKLRELYTTTDQKARFYRAVKDYGQWKDRPTGRTSYSSVKEKDAMGTGTPTQFPIVSRNISPNLVFGFNPSLRHIRDRLFRDITAGTMEDPRLRLRIIGTNAPPQKRESFVHTLSSLPLGSMFPNHKIVLISDRRDFFSHLAKREIRSSYILIALLIMVMTVGTIIFYKYIAREEELLRLKAEFVDSVSHTLKTPLARMGLLAENIRRGWVKDEAKKEQFLETIMAETSRMNDMINNMLNFSRIDSGKKQYEFSDASLQDIVTSTLDQYQSHIAAAGFSSRREIDSTLPLLRLDPDAIKLVLVNLLQNAVKYSDQQKHIEVRLFRAEDFAVLEVQDQGMGIAQRDRQQIFDKFFRATDSNVKAREGSGLGLFLVHHAVAAHNGKVEVSSEPGEGSTFRVYLPMGKR